MSVPCRSLTPTAARRGDVVFTPEWVAQDMLNHFPVAGRVLDPCCGPGGGVFSRLLAGREGVAADWCEIADGRDFFAWRARVDWVVGNPPYSMTRDWFRHSCRIAANLLYLVPLRNVFSGYGFLREITGFGGMREIRVYGTGNALGFPMGNAVGAFWIQADWRGDTRISMPPPEGVVALWDDEGPVSPIATAHFDCRCLKPG